MSRRFFAYGFSLTLVGWFVFVTGSVFALEARHAVYFAQTDYELEVFHIRGVEPGKTVMIIGGIQGDEPGGYLAADLYADITLRKGNLILVPRANFLSIVKNKRQINFDMNRRFDQKHAQDYEDKVVAILKDLMSQSDILLNLHEGSGFYRDTWINGQKNPKRFGQSIIADIAVAHVNNKEIRLQEMASVAIAKVNAFIDNEDYRFRFNNHNTQSSESLHKEQRRSATYYALYQVGIPAFGIETSKDIQDLRFKVKMQSMVINAFMEMFDIEQENPSIFMEHPKLKYALIRVNDKAYQVAKPGSDVVFQAGDKIAIEHLEANYKRGLTVDIEGLGNTHDLNSEVLLTRDAWAHFRKDKFDLGKILLKVEPRKDSSQPETSLAENVCPPPPAKTADRVSCQPAPYSPAANGAIESVLIRVNGKPHVISQDETLALRWGDTIQVLGSLSESNALHKTLIHNFVGYVGGVNGNEEDDTGLVIPLKKSELLARFSENKTGDMFHIYTKNNDVKVAKFYVKLNP